MADHTSHYNLTKPLYGETADVGDINRNMDALDAIIYDVDDTSKSRVADEYNPASIYNTGMYCIHEGLLYRCNAGNVTGDWDASKWLLTKTTAIMRNQDEDIRTLRISVGSVGHLINSVFPEDYDEISTTYPVGDLCIYLNELYRCKATTSGPFDDNAWDLVTFDDVFERKHTWSLLETYTADGTSRTIQRALPAGVNGIFVRFTLTAASANAEFGVVVKTAARHGLGDIANYLQTSTGYGLCRYTREGGFWEGYLSQRVSSLQASATHAERLDNFVLDDADAEYIEFRSNTTGAVIPSGSTFEIYVRR